MIENKNQQRTDLSEFGEFGLIEYLMKNFELNQNSTIKGIGDDAAVLDFKNKQITIANNLLVEGIHFDLSYMPLKHLGYKSVIMGISKIVAMNAKPSQGGISIALSNRFSLEATEALIEGIMTASRIYNIDIVSTTITSSQKGLIINTYILGEVETDEIIYRVGAKENDLLIVTGDIGAAYMGLQVLEREKQVFEVNPNNQPNLENYDYLIERQLKPEARKDIKGLLKILEIKPTAMISLSDGLATDSIQLCKQSHVGCTIYEEKLPLDPLLINTCEEFNIDSTTVAINGGEDYELLFTIKMNDFEKIKGNPNFTVIGHMVSKEEGYHLITRANTKVEIKSRGWKNNKKF